MRTRILALFLCTLAAFLVSAPALSAQTLVDVPPPEFEDPSIDGWEADEETSPFHRKRFEDTYTEKIQAGQIHVVASEMISLFDAQDWGENEPRQEQIMNQLQRLLGAMSLALRLTDIDGPLDTLAEQDIFIGALNGEGFGLHDLRIETLTDTTGNDVSVYFKGLPDELILYEWTEDEEAVLLLLTPEQMRQWRLLQNALSDLVNKQVLLVGEKNVQELEDAVERWENFLDRGYSQMPWESLVNGWLIETPGFPELGPPGHQWILLHPTVGLELSVDPLDEAKVKEAMHVEFLGHIWYRGEQLGDYWGVSATVSLREDLDPGIGVQVHIKRNWNLGVTWHDVDEDPYVFFSVDLFRFAKQSASKYVAEYEDVRAQLGLD
jgi:hypothetical protein